MEMGKLILEDHVSHDMIFFWIFPYFIKLVKWSFLGHSSFYFIKYLKSKRQTNSKFSQFYYNSICKVKDSKLKSPAVWRLFVH